MRGSSPLATASAGRPEPRALHHLRSSQLGNGAGNCTQKRSTATSNAVASPIASRGCRRPICRGLVLAGIYLLLARDHNFRALTRAHIGHHRSSGGVARAACGQRSRPRIRCIFLGYQCGDHLFISCAIGTSYRFIVGQQRAASKVRCRRMGRRAAIGQL
jgi:hypothetical protein